jgi:hypothetical protein
MFPLLVLQTMDIVKVACLPKEIGMALGTETGLETEIEVNRELADIYFVELRLQDVAVNTV